MATELMADKNRWFVLAAEVEKCKDQILKI